VGGWGEEEEELKLQVSTVLLTACHVHHPTISVLCYTADVCSFSLQGPGSLAPVLPAEALKTRRWLHYAMAVGDLRGIHGHMGEVTWPGEKRVLSAGG